MTKKIITLLNLLLWPLSLLLTNRSSNLIIFAAPVILLAIGYLLYKNKSEWFFIPILAIPLFSAKLSFYPLIFTSVIFITDIRDKTKSVHYKNIASIIVSLLLLILFIKPQIGESIFYRDYESQQKVLRNITLYPNVLFARVFQNKGRIIVDKFANNFSVVIDPNNYFFENHPRELSTTPNIPKFPYLSIVFFIIGLVGLNKIKNIKFIVASLVAGCISVSLLKTTGGVDFVLYLPVFLIIVSGLNIFEKYKNTLMLYGVIFITITVWELVRIFVRFQL